MPKYAYYCNECKEGFEIKHSLRKTWSICEFCGHDGKLERRPSMIFVTKKQGELVESSKPGEVMKATIEETKQDIANEQEQLRKRVYKK